LSYLRWTVDEPADFELIKEIYEALYPYNPVFTTKEILNFLDQNPNLKSINTQFQRNEGLQKSRGKDLSYLESRGKKG